MIKNIRASEKKRM